METNETNVNNQIIDLKKVISSLENLKSTIESLGNGKSPSMISELDITKDKLSFYKSELINLLENK